MELYDLIDKFSKLPRSQRLMAIGLSYVALLLACWFLLVAPKRGHLVKLEATQSELQTKKTEVEGRAAQKDRREAEFEDLSAQFTSARRELPNGDEIAELLTGLSQIGRQVGLEMRQFVRDPEEMKEYYAEIPVQLEVRGTYHEIAMFFDKLSKLPRIVYVRDLQLVEVTDAESSDSEEAELTGTGILTTFRYLSEEEILAAAEAAKDKKGKRRKKK